MAPAADGSSPRLVPPAALDPKEFRPFKVISKEHLTHDTLLLRFELPPGMTAGLPVASCLVTKCVTSGSSADTAWRQLGAFGSPCMTMADLPGQDKPIIRPYTPTSSKEAVGYLDLVVKAYPTGLMSKHISDLNVGDSLEIKGPIIKLPITPNLKKHIALIAGGSGITPMIQVIEEILGNPEDKTELSLIFGNNTEQDIILRDHLERLVQRYPGRFKVWFVISQGKFTGSTLPPGTVRSVGLIDKTLIQSFIPGPREDVLVLVCGPPGMMKAISGGKAQVEVDGALKELGYTKDQVFKF